MSARVRPTDVLLVAFLFECDLVTRAGARFVMSAIPLGFVILPAVTGLAA